MPIWTRKDTALRLSKHDSQIVSDHPPLAQDGKRLDYGQSAGQYEFQYDGTNRRGTQRFAQRMWQVLVGNDRRGP